MAEVLLAERILKGFGVAQGSRDAFGNPRPATPEEVLNWYRLGEQAFPGTLDAEEP